MTQNIEMHNDLAVLEHRVKQLEKEPPRVRSLENEVGVIKSTIETMTRDVSDVKTEVHDIKQRMELTATRSDVEKIRDSVVKIMAYGAACLTVLGIVATLLTVTENAKGVFS